MLGAHGPRSERGGPGSEPDDEAGIGDCPPGCLVGDRAPGNPDDDRGRLGERLFGGGPLGVPHRFLASCRDEGARGHPGRPVDEVVVVHVAPARRFSQEATDGRLSAAHHPDEHDATGWCVGGHRRIVADPQVGGGAPSSSNPGGSCARRPATTAAGSPSAGPLSRSSTDRTGVAGAGSTGAAATRSD